MNVSESERGIGHEPGGHGVVASFDGPSDASHGADRPRGRSMSRFANAAKTMTASDEGAGTVLGLMLIVVVAMAIVIAAGLGRMMVGRSRAATAADLSSLSAANALWKGGDPCAVAARVARSHEATLVSCVTGGDTGEDVTVQVSVDIGIPFVPDMTQSARAGPTVCE